MSLRKRPMSWLKRYLPAGSDRRRAPAELERPTGVTTPAHDSAARSDLQSRHAAIALRYRQFIDQDLAEAIDYAEQHAASPPGESRAWWSAVLARDLCVALFALPVVSQGAASDRLEFLGRDGAALAARLADTAAQLRAAVAAAPVPPWNFACFRGARIDPGYQRPWGACDPALPVGWVVAPAYVADGQVVVGQRVYTSSHRS